MRTGLCSQTNRVEAQINILTLHPGRLRPGEKSRRRPAGRGAVPSDRNCEFPSFRAHIARPKTASARRFPHPPLAPVARAPPLLFFIGCCGQETNARASQWEWPTASLSPGSRRRPENPEVRGAVQCGKPTRGDEQDRPTNGESARAGPEGRRRRRSCQPAPRSLRTPGRRRRGLAEVRGEEGASPRALKGLSREGCGRAESLGGVREGAARQNDLSPVPTPLWASVSPFLAQ